MASNYCHRRKNDYEQKPKFKTTSNPVKTRTCGHDAWNDMSSEYDNSVELNPDHVISGFISEEIRITSKSLR